VDDFIIDRNAERRRKSCLSRAAAIALERWLTAMGADKFFGKLIEPLGRNARLDVCRQHLERLSD
jgi:hypothetical protein